MSLYLECLLSPDLQHQQPLQTVGHRLQCALRKRLHFQPSTVRHARLVVEAHQWEERPIRWQGGAGELREEVGCDPWAAAQQSVPGRQHGRLQMSQVSEEASSYGRKLDARVTQQSSHCLERRRCVLCLLLEFEFPQLYSLRPTTVSLPVGGRWKE